MSLTLKGYDLFSLGQFRAALQEAVLPAAAGQAGLAPAILASIRSLNLGEAHEAAAAALLEDALSRGSATAVQLAATQAPLPMALDLSVTQAQLLICDGAGAVGGDCTILPDQQNDRGAENYSG